MKKVIVQKVRVAIYCRVSSDEAGQSLAEQVHICKELIQSAAKSRGILYEILYVLSEEVGTSGKDDKRPEYQKTLRLIDQKAIDWLAAKEISRLSRNIGDFHKLVEKCRKSNVSIFVTGLEIDLKSPTGEIVPNIMAVFAQYERQMISQRTKSSIRSLAITKSKIHGQTIVLGFKKCPNESGVWLPIIEEIQIVEMIFRTFLKLKSYKSTIDHLKRLGVKTKTGKDFNFHSIKRLLENRKYIGKLRVPGEDYEVDLPFGEVIPIDLFESVQKYVKAIDGILRMKTRNPNRIYLLSGLLTSSAGHQFRGVSACGRGGIRYYYYRSSADDLTLSCDEIEKAIIQSIEYVSRKEGLDEYKAEVENQYISEKEVLKRNISLVTKEIDLLTSLKTKSLDAILSSIDVSSVLVSEVEKRIISINSQIQAQTLSREDLSLQLENLVATNAGIDSLERLAKAEGGLAQDYSNREAVRGWFRELFNKVIVDVDARKINIFWNDQITGGKMILPFKIDIPVGSKKNAMESVLEIKGESISDSRIYHLATQQKLTSSEIAKDFGVARSTVSKHLKKLGIPTYGMGQNKKRVRGVSYGGKVLITGQTIKLSTEQKTLSAIRIWRSQDKTFREIADLLNVQGIPTKTGRGKWHGKTIQQILGKTSL